VSLIVLESCDLAFGGRSILSGLNLRIGEEDRVGLVGRNGSGKTCLLRILARQQEPDSGAVRTANAMRTGYLPQEVDVAGGRSLIDSVLASVPGRIQLEQALEVVEQELAEAQTESEQMELSEKLATLHDDLLHFDGNFSPHEAHAILDGLGFRPGDAQRDLSEFSGGWKMRAVMASLLFQKPDLLMLDEPTNHLDVTTIGWLADFLKRFRNALVLVCHDRDFLNEQINRVVSYEPEGVRQYAGNYEDYRRQRAEEAEVLERRAANLARQREQAERFIRRFRAQATKARAVQSRIRALDKLDDVVTLSEERSLSFRFPPCQRSGIDVVTIKDLGHAYGSQHVFDGVSATIRRGDKVAIIGPNGAGKTTLLKILAGEMATTRGEVKLGHNVKPGYYAQHVTEKLDVRNTIFDEVWQHSAYDDITQVRNVLGTFLFSDDDVEKGIRVLSGGEKARVALARLMVDPGNLLLMDEPTNHLDLESSEALADALSTYDGTIAFVSHNRTFVRRLATRIWHVHDGTIEEFPGTLDEFLYHLAQARRRADKDGAGRPVTADVIDRPVETVAGNGSQAARKSRDSKARGAPTAPGAGQTPHPAGAQRSAQTPHAQARAEAARPQKNKARELERRIADYEARIAAIEKAQEERSRELSDPAVYADHSRYGTLLAAYTDDKNKLEELMLRWEQAQASLAEMS